MITADLMRERFQYVESIVSTKSQNNCHAEVSKLRVEEVLLSGVGRYEFDIKKEGIRNQYEQTLNRNDVFIPTRIALYVALQSNNKPSKEILYAYIPVASTKEVPTIHPVGFTSDDANAFYNGKLTWQIQNGVLFSGYPTERFKHIPQTQGFFALNAADVAVNLGVQSEFSIDLCSEVAIPRIYIAGTMDHKIAVNFDAAGLDFSCTEGYTPKLVFYMDGFLVKGGTQYFNGENPFGADVVGSWGV